MSVVSTTCYELLGVPVDAPRSELARAWKHQRDELAREPDRYTPEQVEALCSRLDEAFAILADPDRSKRYRAYMAQRAVETTSLAPDDFLHPVVAEWAAKSTAIPAPAAPSPEGHDATVETELPFEPPPWLAEHRSSRAPVEQYVEEAVQALASAPAEAPPPEIDVFAEPMELDDEPPITADPLGDDMGWGTDPDDLDLARTVPMGPAAPRAEPPDLSSLSSLTGRRIPTIGRPRTRPATTLPGVADDDG